MSSVVSFLLRIITERPNQPDCAAVGFADGETSAVQSANIVGYNTVTITNGYNMLAVNFDTVEGGSINIQDIFDVGDKERGLTPGLTGGTGGATADQIQIFKGGSTYESYFLYFNKNNSNATKNFKWCSTKTGSALANTNLTSGTAFWYKAKDAITPVKLAVSGAVSSVPVQSVTIANGYNMIANKFPCDLNPNKLGTEFWKEAIANGATGGTGGAAADQIQVFKGGSTYESYFLYYNKNNTNATKNYKWCSTKTGSAILNEDADCIKVGNGVWYKSKGANAFTLSFPSPIAK